MVTRICSAALMSVMLALVILPFGVAQAADREAAGDGIVRTRSAYGMAETVDRLKKDVAAKGLVFFNEIDQAKLAADAGVDLRPSTLLVFGGPGLGTLFLTADPDAGLDWPVRLLVYEDDKGDVWVAYTDFGWIAKRHGIADRDKEFKIASGVIASITSAVTK